MVVRRWCDGGAILQCCLSVVRWRCDAVVIMIMMRRHCSGSGGMISMSFSCDGGSNAHVGELHLVDHGDPLIMPNSVNQLAL